MPIHTTTTLTLQPQRHDSRMLIGLVTAIALFAALAICGIGQLVLALVTPHGMIYPHSLLTKLNADYRPWDADSLIVLPTIEPRAVAAVEHDSRPVEGVRLGSVPAAILPLLTGQSTVAEIPTPTPATTPIAS